MRTEAERAAHKRYRDTPKGREKVRELKRGWARRRREREMELEEMVERYVEGGPRRTVHPQVREDLLAIARAFGFSLP